MHLLTALDIRFLSSYIFPSVLPGEFSFAIEKMLLICYNIVYILCG